MQKVQFFAENCCNNIDPGSTVCLETKDVSITSCRFGFATLVSRKSVHRFYRRLA
jgi:hypothetical protein